MRPELGASVRVQQPEPRVRSAFKRVSAPSRPLPDDTPTFNRHPSCYGSCWGVTSRDSAAATSSMLGGGVDGWMDEWR